MTSQYDRRDLEGAAVFAPMLAQYVQLATGITIFVLGWISLSLELLIRKDFGERYISLTRFFLAVMFVGAFRMLVILIFGFGWLAYLFGFAYLIAFIYHRRQITMRNRRGEEWHSMSFGVSRLEGFVDQLRARDIPIVRKWDDWFLYRFLEPAAFFVVGILLWFIDNGLGFYIVVASFALFMKNQMTYSREYNQYLDTVDARIEAKYSEAALNGQQKQRTGGISVVAMPENLAKLLPATTGKAPNFAATVQETVGGDEQTFVVS